MLKVSMRAFLNSILAVLILSSCQEIETNSSASSIDLIGEIEIEELNTNENTTWFNKEFESYQLDSVIMDSLSLYKNKFEEVTITIFLGTWCEDSHKEVPRFSKVMNELGIENTKLIGVDYNKETPAGFEKGKDIRHVPTFIINKGGKELGRIVETPIESIEKDLLTLIQGKKYIPNYAK
ncbi:MAG: thioredoxin family protein [Flavobacteriales bacterium]